MNNWLDFYNKLSLNFGLISIQLIFNEKIVTTYRSFYGNYNSFLNKYKSL